jgi:hypothetical protein
MLPRLAIVMLLFSILPRSAFADDEEPDTVVTHYHHLTLGVDAVGLAALVAGGMAEGPGGRDTSTSNTLFTIGALGMTLGAPAVHLAKGHGVRALGSLGLRAGLASAGMFVAVAANTCDPDKEFLCELDYIGYGFLGGLVVASVIDAAVNTEERVPRHAATWAPTVSATHDGARVGFVAAF